MTDRAEIERLLKATGRTLEGLPKTYDPEFVARSLKGGRCGWTIGGFICHQSDVIELLVGALRDALNERDAALAKVPKWISVDERLPRKDQSVYILIRGRVSYPAKFYSEEEKLFAAFTGDGFFMVGCDRDGGVTHWAPLPELPEGE